MKRVEGKLEPSLSLSFLKELVMAMLAFGSDEDKVQALRLCDAIGLDIGEIAAEAFSEDPEETQSLRRKERCVYKKGRARAAMEGCLSQGKERYHVELPCPCSNLC